MTSVTTWARRAGVLAGMAGIGLTALQANASPRGSEFDASLGPASGGMEGVAVARPVDSIGMLFSNPATLGQATTEHEFLLGGTFVSPDLDASGQPTELDGSAPDNDPSPPLTGQFDGESDLDASVAPNAAAIQRFSEDLVAGMGISAISGLGGDFRNVSGLPNLVSDLKIFGANFGVAYDVTDRLTLGAVGTLGIGQLQMGLTNSSGTVNNFGVGGTGGMTFDAGPVILGAAYKSELDITYDNVLQTGQDSFSDLKLEQPREVQAGIATSDALLADTLIAAEFRWKNWSDADGYSSVWDDQFLGSLGAQHRIGSGPGAVTLRTGYTYSSDIVKDAGDLGNSFGGVSQVSAPNSPNSLPVTPTFLQLAQTTITDGYWSQSVSLGFGVQILEGLRFDLHGSYGFDGEEEIGRFEADGSIWQLGGGLTWKL
ncbi:long-chain fatty acid transport protein [Limimonas halophila]|uniref:Long-chain fatty acid transport protein n=1 Tax=Limimonas halophila TaxID=1082479 RepID=A0A1G7QS70_9PROT|nr:outer membrane protein transport protein [Limimonas halophila]SDG01333.1 long-chain fatty acid transport protein [Limimonas halophila]